MSLLLLLFALSSALAQPPPRFLARQARQRSVSLHAAPEEEPFTTCGLPIPAYSSERVHALAQAPLAAPGADQPPLRSKVVAGLVGGGGGVPLLPIEYGRGSFGRVVPAALVTSSPPSDFEVDALGGGVAGALAVLGAEPLAPGAPARASAAYKQLLEGVHVLAFSADDLQKAAKGEERMAAALAAAREEAAKAVFQAIVDAFASLRPLLAAPASGAATAIELAVALVVKAISKHAACALEAVRKDALEDVALVQRLASALYEAHGSHASLERELAVSAMACSALAPCPFETPVMATLGAVRAAGRLEGAVVEPVFVSRASEDAASLAAVFSRVKGEASAGAVAAWARYSSRVSFVPAKAAGAKGAQLRGLDAILVVIQQVLGGLWHLESRGIQHFDVKPDNIMLSAGAGTAKVVDLGIACLRRGAWGAARRGAEQPMRLQSYNGTSCVRGEALECDLTSIAGTPSYYSPSLMLRHMLNVKQFAERKWSDLKPAVAAYFEPSAARVRAPMELGSADTFSVGAMLLEALTGGTDENDGAPDPHTWPPHTIGLGLVRYLMLDELSSDALTAKRVSAEGPARRALRARVHVRALNVLRAAAIGVRASKTLSPLHRAGGASPVTGLALLDLDSPSVLSRCRPTSAVVKGKMVSTTLETVGRAHPSELSYEQSQYVIYAATADASSRLTNSRGVQFSVVPLRLTYAGKLARGKCSSNVDSPSAMADVDDARPEGVLVGNSRGTVALLDLLANLLTTGLRPGLAPAETSLEALARSVDGVRAALYAQFAADEARARRAPPQLLQPQKRRGGSFVLPHSDRLLPDQPPNGGTPDNGVYALPPPPLLAGDAAHPVAAAAAALHAHLACVRSCERAATNIRATLQPAAAVGAKLPAVTADVACAGAASDADADEADGALAAAVAELRCRDAFAKLAARRVMGVRMTEALSGPAGVTPASAAAVCRLSVCVDAHNEAAVRNLKERAKDARDRDALVKRKRAEELGMAANKAGKTLFDEKEQGDQAAAAARLRELIKEQTDPQFAFSAVKKSPVRGYYKSWSHARSHDLRLRTAVFGEETTPRPVLLWRKVGATGRWRSRPLALAGAIRGIGKCTELRKRWGAPTSKAMSLPTTNPCGAADLPGGAQCECIAIMRKNRRAASSTAAHALALRLAFTSSAEERRFVGAVTTLLTDYDAATRPLPKYVRPDAQHLRQM